VVPVSGFKTLGEVATLNGAVVVSTKEGMLRVEGNGQVVDVAKGKTFTVVPEANAPQGGGGKTPSGGVVGRCCSSTVLWGVTATVAGGVAAILAGLAMSRANDAKSNAAAADTAASSAASAAASAASAAAAAASAAAVALSDANAAAIAAGCALNAAANPTGKGVSPYTPPSGVSCTNQSTW
jgi:hypothetical protein